MFFRVPLTSLLMLFGLGMHSHLALSQHSRNNLPGNHALLKATDPLLLSETLWEIEQPTALQAEPSGADTMAVAPEKKSLLAKGDLVLFPFASFSPETRFAFGTLMINFFKLSQKDTIARTSNVRTALIYTTREQFIVSSEHTIFLKEEKYQLRGNIAYLRFPDNFYGIGNSTTTDNREFFDNRVLNFTGRVLRKVHDRFFVGVIYNYYSMFDIIPGQGSLLENAGIPGAAGARLSGGGILLTYDKRDNVVNAHSGSFAELTFKKYPSVMGSNYSFGDLDLDIRKYFGLAKGHTLAFQGNGKLKYGEVPFQVMSQLGGDRLLRGIYRGRFRDNQMLLLQGEYRWQFSQRFGLVSFMGVGDVAERVNDFQWNTLKYSYGGGARIALNKKERLNIRLDYGIARQSNYFYINLAEAF